MNKEEMLVLEKEVTKQEISLLNNYENLSRKKKQFDALMLDKTSSLERAYKETKELALSNIEKRVSKVMDSPEMIELNLKIEELEHSCKIAEIELKHYKRIMKIHLAFMSNDE